MIAMTKKETIEGPSCLTRAADDELVFVLRAKDPIAGAVIQYWAHLAQATATHEKEKIERAWQEATEFNEWRKNKYF